MDKGRLLLWACRNGVINTVQKLVPIVGVNFHAGSEQWNVPLGSTPLITAVIYKQRVVVEYLLTIPGIDVNLPERRESSRSALHIAMKAYSSAKISRTTYNGGMAVKVIAVSEEEELGEEFAPVPIQDDPIVRALLNDPRVDVEQVNGDGETVLFALVGNYRKEEVMMLLANSRTIQTNLTNNAGWTLDDLLETGVEGGGGFLGILADIKEIVERYRANPAAERQALRKSLGLSIPSPMLFAATVYVSDGFLTVSTEQQDSAARQFFEINSRLPMELQMIVSNRAQNSTRDFISSRESERAFQDLMRNILKD